MRKESKICLVGNLIYLAVLAVFTVVYITRGGMVYKAIASAIFFMGALLNVVAARKFGMKGYPACKYALAAAALACFIGDVAIDHSFIAGVVVFAVGHILYIAAFRTINRLGWGTILPAAAMMIAGIGFILLYPGYDFGDMLAPVIVYAVIISVMFGRAIGIALDRDVPWRLRVCVAFGAVLFVLSDFFLTLHRFADGGRICSVLCLSLYYPAQYLLTLCVLFASDCDRVREKRVKNEEDA